MIIAAIYALTANDLLSAVISVGIVGYSLVICFLLLKAPDLAIVQVVIETITLLIMVAVVLDSSRMELKQKAQVEIEGTPFINVGYLVSLVVVMVFAGVLMFFLFEAATYIQPFGEHFTRMSTAYMGGAANVTGSANLVTGILFDFRGYDTLGEVTVLFTAAVGVMTVLRLRGKKKDKK